LLQTHMDRPMAEKYTLSSNFLLPVAAFSILKKSVTGNDAGRERVNRSILKNDAIVIKIKPKIKPGQTQTQDHDENTRNSEKNRAPTFTKPELTLLLDLVNNDYHFAHGHWDRGEDSDTDPSILQLIMKERWMDITSRINSVGGYDRDWREVKKKLTWWMSKVKKKAANIHAYNILSHNSNGRKRVPPKLSNLEIRVLALLNEDQDDDAAAMLQVDLADSEVSCKVAEGERAVSETSQLDPVVDDTGKSDDNCWRLQPPEHLSKLMGDAGVSLKEINKSVKALVEIGEKRMKLEERKLRMAEELVQTQKELVQTQKELNANILKLMQGNTKSV